MPWQADGGEGMNDKSDEKAHSIEEKGKGVALFP